MFMTITGSILLLAAAQGAPEATTQKDEKEEAVQKATEKKTKKVCKTQTLLGSRIPQRICMTQAEWDEMAENARKAHSNSTNRASSCSAGGPC